MYSYFLAVGLFCTIFDESYAWIWNAFDSINFKRIWWKFSDNLFKWDFFEKVAQNITRCFLIWKKIVQFHTEFGHVSLSKEKSSDICWNRKKNETLKSSFFKILLTCREKKPNLKLIFEN